MFSNDQGRGFDRVILLLLLGLLLFASPLLSWWMSPNSAWYIPYVLWAFIIGLTAWHQIRRGRRDI